jgi:hypothetical protein
MPKGLVTPWVRFSFFQLLLNNTMDDQPYEVPGTSETETAEYAGEYDPNRNCGDFSTQAEAQAFFEAAGGPESDPHRLDADGNGGAVCESL